MKYIIPLTLLCLLFFILMFSIYNVTKERELYIQQCKSMGGAVVYSQHAINCWKDQGYINVD